MDELVFRVFKPDTSTGTTYCPSDLRATDGVLNVPEPLVLYDVAPATVLPPEGDPEVARTVVLAGGLEIDARPSRLFGQYAQMGGARVDEATCFADASFDGLYVLTPESPAFGIPSGDPGFPIRAPTTLAEGTRVDLFVLGGVDRFELSTGVELRPGEFTKFGTGTVVDGMVVSDVGASSHI